MILIAWLMYPSKFTITWGPSLWRFLHVISFTYPDTPSDKDKDSYRKFFSSLGEVIPCPGCANHYKEYTAEHPIALESKETLSRWMYDFHNHVNVTKPVSDLTSPVPSFEEVKYFYTNWDKDRATRIQNLSQSQAKRALGSPYMQTEHQNEVSGGYVVLAFVIFIWICVAIYLWLKK